MALNLHDNLSQDMASESDLELLAVEESYLPETAGLGRLVRVIALTTSVVLAAVLLVTVPRPGGSRGPAVAEAQAVEEGINSKSSLDQWLYDGKWDMVGTSLPPAAAAAATGYYSAGGAAATTAAPMGPMALAVPENLHDGNVCGQDEEMFAGLCYKKCALLANGFPIRTSSFSCCASHPCGLQNQKVSVSMPCSGFDVGGDINGEEGECPHAAGTCLQDEEMLLGLCYKKCVILTNGAFPFRVAAATCCKTTGFGCLNPMNLVTDFVRFNVGGGLNDGDPRTPGQPHQPMPELTEAK